MRFRRSKLYVSVIPIVVLGSGIGILGSILGLGGGFILVPALIYLLRVPTNVVIGTSLAYTLVTMAVATVLHATANKSVDIMLAVLLIAGGVVGAQFGAQVGQALRGEQLRALLALRAACARQPLPDAGPVLFLKRPRRGAMSRLAVLALAIALPSSVACGESLISTLSDDAVEITSNFTGEQIVVFGAIRGTPEPNTAYQVAVVVQGPDQDVMVRQKERVVGIWANRTAREFVHVPSYYVMHLSENFSSALNPADLVQYRLGVSSLPFVQDSTGDATAQRFASALVGLKSARGLYAERKREVEFLAPNVFRTTFFLPSDIPTGEYRVSVYAFRGETFLAGQTQILAIAKGGFSQRIARAAIDFPLAYGLVCVALSVFSGWLAGVIFRRP
jgi:uncharacterized protein (TIGR02186 family)